MMTSMNVLSDVSRPWLALSLLPGVGSATLRAIHASGQWDRRADSLWALAHDLNISRLAKALETQGALRRAEQEALAQVKMAIRYNARIISALDEDFPTHLLSSRYNPFLLFVRGQLAAPNTRALAIVGTRKPTDSGKSLARQLGREAGENGWSVVSGLALGCDAAAHKGALEGNGHTVAVMAHGLHTVEPSRHQDLAREILAKGGALVSHFSFGVEAEPKYFVQRDAIQSGMSEGVAMVQSDINGGSLHAVRAALADNRWVWVAPVSAQDLKQPDRPAAGVVRANEILLGNNEEEKRMMLRRKEGESIEGILPSGTPFPAGNATHEHQAQPPEEAPPPSTTVSPVRSP